MDYRKAGGGAGSQLDPVPSNRKSWVIRAVAILAAPYMRIVMGVRRLQVLQPENALRAQLAPGRTIFAFRHPSRDDPMLLYRVLTSHLPGTFGGKRLRARPVFLYGRGVPVWGGPLVAWLLPRIGALSVYQGRMNRESYEMVQEELRTGKDPIALAPEGQVVYHNERVSVTQRGTAILALDAAEHGPVTIVPVGIRYRYPKKRGNEVSTLLRPVFRDASTPVPPQAPDRELVIVGAQAVLENIANAYRRRYPKLWAAVERQTSKQTTAFGPIAPVPSEKRLEELSLKASHVREVALRALERTFGLRPDGALLPRLFMVRYRLYELMFPLKSGTEPNRKTKRSCGPMSTWRRTLYDIDAAEAHVLARHMEVADILSYLDFTYLQGNPDEDRIAEYALSVVDLRNRAVGGTIGHRPAWRGREATVTFGGPIQVLAGERGSRSGKNRNGANGRNEATELQNRIEQALKELSQPTRS